MRWLLAFCVLALAAVAAAHPGDEFEVLTAESGPVTFYVTPQTLVVKAQRDVLFVGEAASLASEGYAPLLNATWAIEARGPGNASLETQPYGYGFAARANFSAPGEWTFLMTANGTSAQVPIVVYPPTSVRAESSALRYDLFYAGRLAKTSVYFVDDESGALVKRDASVLARVERWENGSKMTEEIVPLKAGRSLGDFSFEHAFAEEGAYRVRFASLEHGVDFEDLPPFKVNVLAARLADPVDAARETTGWGLAALVGIFAVAALSWRR